jgi:hypothetical protein
LSYSFHITIKSNSNHVRNALEKDGLVFAQLGIFTRNLFEEYATTFNKGGMANDKVMQIHEKLGRAQSLLQRVHNLATEAAYAA